jgi:hypothetical protein
MRARYVASASGLALLAVALAACTQHEERAPTPFLKFDIVRPTTGDSGVVVSGPKEEVAYVNRGGSWSKLGVGHGTGYMVLANGSAVLLDLHDGKGLQLVRSDGSVRPIPASLGRAGVVVVTPEPESIDVYQEENSREARIFRFDIKGTPLAEFSVSLPAEFSDCRLGHIAGYDAKLLPYVIADCNFRSPQAGCVLLAPPDIVRAIPPERFSDCSGSPPGRISLREPSTYVLFR